MSADAPEPMPLFVTVGDNDARAFGMAADVRADALARKAGMEPAPAAVAGPLAAAMERAARSGAARM